MQIIMILFCIIILWGCTETPEDSIENKNLTNFYPETGTAEHQRAAIQHVDSIILQEDNTHYVGVVWNLVASGGFYLSRIGYPAT